MSVSRIRRLMPVDPVTRAQFRLALYPYRDDWYSLAEQFRRSATASRLSRRRKMFAREHPVQRRGFGARNAFS